MKYMPILKGMIVSILLLFTILYFTKPRVRVVEHTTVVDRIIKEIPPKVDIKFGPSKPDSVYTISVKCHGVREELIASRKRFNKTILGKKNDAIIGIDSEVISYSTVPARLLENNITVTTDKEKLSAYLKTLTPKSRSKFWTGCAVGAIAGGIVVLVLK